MKSIVLGSVLGALLSLLNGCGSDGGGGATQTIAERAVASYELSTLVAALSAADLVDMLNGTDVFTVFAPTDDAFKTLDPDLLSCLLDPVGISKLTDLLKYHVVAGESLTSDLKGDDVKLTTLYNNATLAIKTVDGITLTVNGVNQTVVDIVAKNGVIHEIHGVLLPDGFEAPQCGTMSVADLAVNTTTLSTLVAALSAAGLVDVFNGTDVFTVFAPTDEAFKALDPDLLACLLDPVGIPKLTELLKYHVVPGYTLAKDLSNDEKLTTLDNKTTLAVKVDGESVMVNNANVTLPNNYATNGVVHVIDGVLIPDDFDPPTCNKTFSSIQV